MGLRNQIIYQQFASAQARKALGFVSAGVPGYVGNLDLVASVGLITSGLNIFEVDANYNDYFGLKKAFSVSGLSGSFTVGLSPSTVDKQIITVLAIINGSPADGSEYYSAILSASGRYDEAGGTTQIFGATEVLMERKFNVGASSSLDFASGPTGLSLEFTYDSGQLTDPYNWHAYYLAFLNNYE